MAKLAKKAKIPEGIAAKRKGKPAGFVSASAGVPDAQRRKWQTVSPPSTAAPTSA